MQTLWKRGDFFRHLVPSEQNVRHLSSRARRLLRSITSKHIITHFVLIFSCLFFSFPPHILLCCKFTLWFWVLLASLCQSGRLSKLKLGGQRSCVACRAVIHPESLQGALFTVNGKKSRTMLPREEHLRNGCGERCGRCFFVIGNIPVGTPDDAELVLQ